MNNSFEVIIVGGSYAGLAAAMALGRALRRVLIIDSGKPCNQPTPHSHNFLTQDGQTPEAITALAKVQVLAYKTIRFINGLATQGVKNGDHFEITTNTGASYTAKKLLLATGIKDMLPALSGIAECWGISVLHCPYCHGYEIREKPTGILGNGVNSYEFSALISNWTKDLTLFTNGKSTLTVAQTATLRQHNIQIVEDEIERLKHDHGHLQEIVFKNARQLPLTALYTRPPFTQHSHLPLLLGCRLNEDGYIETDPSGSTNIRGLFACGDNTTRIRTVATAVSTGTTAGIMINKQLVEESFD